ncbi:MAG TPA: NapC/NirT family cytochrome c [Candidatus Nitrosotenuis sp.]|jgi:nitrate/TMAO reductase-like tetraheme cytochrome c subunit|nr:NapC/NirT family cytochrome c [Candidatus Nitrosotenuis sp.]
MSQPEHGREGEESGILPDHRGRRRRQRIRLLKLAALVAAVGLVSLFGLYEYSASPSFCASCHIMTPYVQAWKASSHKEVACVECHYPPGTRDTLIQKVQNINQVVKYVTRTYGSKPYAEIEDASCLRSGCHSTRLLEGRLEFGRGILFDHAPHLTGKGSGQPLRCTSCHAQIVVGRHMEINASTCFLCHFKEQTGARQLSPLGDCQMCHTAPDAPLKVAGRSFVHKDFLESSSANCQDCHHDISTGDGQAPEERCLECHDQPEKLERYGDTAFLHDSHLASHNVACTRCHGEIEHRLRGAERFAEPFCQECHTDMHRATRDLFVGQGGRGTPPMPGHMYLAQVDCVACHVQASLRDQGQAPLAGQTYVASDAACASCHSDTYQGMVADWKKAFDAMLAELTPREQALRRLVLAPAFPAGKRKEALEKLEAARHNMDMVRLGRGLHNAFYAAELLRVATLDLDRVAELAGRDPRPLAETSPLRQGSCATLCHLRAGVETPAEVTLEDSVLPHLDHVESYGLHCNDCHSSQQHGALRQEMAGCAECHHGEEAPSCATCHRQEAAFVQGRLGGRTFRPNPPGDSAGCQDCHPDGARADPEAVARRYGGMTAAWVARGAGSLQETQRQIEAARSLLSRLPPARRQFLARLLDKAEATVAEIRAAGGVHNPQAARQALEQVRQVVEGVRQRAAVP